MTKKVKYRPRIKSSNDKIKIAGFAIFLSFIKSRGSINSLERNKFHGRGEVKLGRAKLAGDYSWYYMPVE